MISFFQPYPFGSEAKVNSESFNWSNKFKLGPFIPGITILISEFKSKGKSFGESPKPIISIFWTFEYSLRAFIALPLFDFVDN